MTERRAPALLEPAVFAAVLLFNLCARSAFWNFDGVACAVAVELSDFKHLVHGNHLAYGPLAWLFDRSWRLLGYQGRALLPLQVLSGLLGAAGAAALARLLRRLGAGNWEAGAAAAALAASAAWWLWSLEAQVYMLGAFPLVMAFSEALSERPRPAVVGLWHAAAMLGHAGHAMAAPALAFLLRPGGRRAWGAWLASAAAFVLAAYAAAGLLAVRPGSAAQLKAWLLGSAALGNARAFEWHGPASALDALAGWLSLCAGIFAAPGALGWLALLPLAAAARGLALPGRAPRALGLWLLAYAALYTSWEPRTAVYRVSDLPALWALAWLGLSARLPSPRARAGLLALWAAAAAAWNWRMEIGPACDPSRNGDWREAVWAAANTPEDAWLVATARGQIYVPYFGGRKPLNARYLDSPEEAARRVAAIEAGGGKVFVTSRSRGFVRRELSACRLEEAARGEGLVLYRVRAAASRRAGAGKG